METSAIRNYFIGKNFMTPVVIRYGKTNTYLYELSEGNKVSSFELYGVTVLELGGKHRHDLSRSFNSMNTAEEYIMQLG